MRGHAAGAGDDLNVARAVKVGAGLVKHRRPGGLQLVNSAADVQHAVAAAGKDKTARRVCCVKLADVQDDGYAVAADAEIRKTYRAVFGAAAVGGCEAELEHGRNIFAPVAAERRACAAADR